MKIKKKQTKAIEEHRKQLVESNEFIKKVFNIHRDRIPLKKQKLIEGTASEFKNLEKKLILIIWFISTKLEEEVRKVLEIMKFQLSYIKFKRS